MTSDAALNAIAAEPTAAQTSATVPAWSGATRVAFRFVFVYLVMYALPFPLDVIPGVNRLAALWGRLQDAIVVWTAENVLHATISARPAGSGDTTWNYVQLFCFFGVALLITILWTVLDRRRVHYRKLLDGLRVYVRYDLAFTMITYGAFKVIQSQFPALGLEQLQQPYGESSPMGLLWSFMGYSYGYNMFTGAGEILGGVLLFFPKLTALGALVTIGVMSHVVALNFSYDTPVKLFSSHLVLAGVFLVAPDARRLARVFVLNQPAARSEIRPLFARRAFNNAAVVLRILLMGFALLSALSRSYNARQQWLRAVNPPLRGIYDVEAFVRNGVAVPALLGDAMRWRRLTFDRQGILYIRTMDDSTRIFRLQPDTVAHTLNMSTFADTLHKFTLQYARPDTTVLHINGVFGGDSIDVTLRRFDESRFFLVSRGFHWINERPINR